MFFLPSLLFTAISFQIAQSAELCKEKEWFDDLSGKCQPCKVCPEKAFEMAPCLELSNTMCVNLVEIGRSINVLKSSSDPNSGLKYRHKWHEMEGAEEINANAVFTAEQKFAPKSEGDYDNLWSQVICVVLSMTIICIAISVVMMTLKYIRKAHYPCENRNVGRGRLFSRDRLNTTEYMNNLATLDRRLAIDEILEKRKRAIFEPQLLHENIYTDEVFVDLSGVPRNLRDDHPYEELDHRKCLLQMQDRQ